MPKLIGHIEKVEEEELEEQLEGDETAVEKNVGGGLTADKGAVAAEETGDEQMTGKDTERIDEMAKPTEKDETAGTKDKDDTVEGTGSLSRKPRSTASITRLKEERRRAKIKEQEHRWKEATEKDLGKAPSREIDLEDAMLSPEEGEKQQTSEKQKTDEREGYSKVYTKTHEKWAKQSLSQAEKRGQDKKSKREEAAQKVTQEAADRMAQDEAKRII